MKARSEDIYGKSTQGSGPGHNVEKYIFTGLQRCCWQYGSIFIRLAVVSTQICKMPRNSPKLQTYSSSRSSEVISEPYAASRGQKPQIGLWFCILLRHDDSDCVCRWVARLLFCRLLSCALYCSAGPLTLSSAMTVSEFIVLSRQLVLMLMTVDNTHSQCFCIVSHSICWVLMKL